MTGLLAILRPQKDVNFSYPIEPLLNVRLLIKVSSQSNRIRCDNFFVEINQGQSFTKVERVSFANLPFTDYMHVQINVNLYVLFRTHFILQKNKKKKIETVDEDESRRKDKSDFCLSCP